MKPSSDLKEGDLIYYSSFGTKYIGIYTEKLTDKAVIGFHGISAIRHPVHDSSGYMTYDYGKWKFEIDLDLENLIRIPGQEGMRAGSIVVANDSTIIVCQDNAYNVYYYDVTKREKVNSFGPFGIVFNKYDIMIATDRVGTSFKYDKIISMDVT